ncbi:hypothetical protein CYMTET_14283 [Cymbomonas tetramitiformis]|uniref:Core Histone H2A/H2B/H3 domain-containing protein n=1 Tax=Cymbomonas tetramitiformis TaxID=36881 RepID=A0AAE0LAH9_9CHLO|nr:hypothetical protein CYMTET_14283 [Cymbomonas tetramitiformis]
MPRIKHIAQKNRGLLVAVADKAAISAAEGGEAPITARKPHRYRSGTVALRQIKHLQKNANHTMFPQKSFERVVRDILGSESAAPDVRITKNAVSALKEASEFLLTEVMYFRRTETCEVFVVFFKSMLVMTPTPPFSFFLFRQCKLDALARLAPSARGRALISEVRLLLCSLECSSPTMGESITHWPIWEADIRCLDLNRMLAELERRRRSAPSETVVSADVGILAAVFYIAKLPDRNYSLYNAIDLPVHTANRDLI